MIKTGEQREIGFQRELRYQRQKMYDIQEYEKKEFHFENGNRKVYGNINFSIFVDDYCNADCKFCVAQLRFQHRKLAYQKKRIEDCDQYLTRLEEILKKVRPINPSVSITGGEPTLSPILPDILRLVKKYDFRKRTITTNGSGLLRTCQNDSILNHLIANGWNHLNISRAHYEDSKNQEIMQYQDLEQYCCAEQLKEILQEIKGTSLQHRLSCILLKEGIKDVEDMKKYIAFHKELGANNFIFRELMDYDKSAVNKEKMEYCTRNKIRLSSLWETMENDRDFTPYLNILGYYYYVEIYRYLNCTVASESADLNQQYVQKEKDSSYLYEMIFHVNGNLCGSWVDSEEILDEYQKG